MATVIMRDLYEDPDEDELSPRQCSAPRETPCEFLTGRAGTGKTFDQIARVAEDPSYGILTATTGIAAVNLGATTVHALLKYSDTSSLQDSWIRGSLAAGLHALAKRVRWLIIDECSMLPDRQLDFIYQGVSAANQFADVETPMGIRLVGDLAQLPPVPEPVTRRVPWVFEAGCWGRFRDNTTRLAKQWRQTEGDNFYMALNMVRAGMGQQAAILLEREGARFHSALDTEFPGTTILPRNDQVGKFNQMGLLRVRGESFTVTARRWGQQRSEWGQNLKTREWGIPPATELKIGAYVMILSNAPDFEYCNGDCGVVEQVRRSGSWNDYGGDVMSVRLTRNNELVLLPKIVRGVEHVDKPAGYKYEFDRISSRDDHGGYRPNPHYRGRVRRWVTGQVEYFPVRLAYATTVHKSQSLTLDRVQVDYRDHFFASPGMLYTALSRCRTLQGLRLVGQPEVFAKHCQFDQRVKEWL